MFVAQYFVARREWPLSAAQIVAHQTELGAKGAAQLLERLGTIEFAIDSENLVMSFQPPGSHVGGRLTLSPRTTPAEIYSSIRLESTVPPQKP
jgi:hypothetical protein